MNTANAASIDVEFLNSLSEDKAKDALTKCCGAAAWVNGMLMQRPFPDATAVIKEATEIWQSLPKEDWLEAFTHHPKIGDISSLREKFANTKNWASNEQSGVEQADEPTVKALAAKNKEYEEKFGHIFIVCATGKSAKEMLSILESRLHNPAETELTVAAGEQLKITILRLQKLSPAS